jgi:hypothetical protein
MTFGDGDGSGENNGTYFETCLNIALERYPWKNGIKYFFDGKNRDIRWLHT